MASRKTLVKAQELVVSLQEKYPDATFKIEDNSQRRRIGRVVAEEDGFEITEDDGGIMVEVNYTQFDVVEVRQCGCGEEITTIAIGEYGLDECAGCKTKRAARQEAESKERREIQDARLAEADWRDKWEEPQWYD